MTKIFFEESLSPLYLSNKLVGLLIKISIWKHVDDALKACFLFSSESIEVFVTVHADYPRQAPLLLLSFKDGKNKVNQDVDLKVNLEIFQNNILLA